MFRTNSWFCLYSRSNRSTSPTEEKTRIRNAFIKFNRSVLAEGRGFEFWSCTNNLCVQYVLKTVKEKLSMMSRTTNYVLDSKYQFRTASNYTYIPLKNLRAWRSKIQFIY